MTVVGSRREVVSLTAPCDGVMRLHAPRALCGELEVFEPGEPVISVGDRLVHAPAAGFIARALVSEHDYVREGTVLLRFSMA